MQTTIRGCALCNSYDEICFVDSGEFFQSFKGVAFQIKTILMILSVELSAFFAAFPNCSPKGETPWISWNKRFRKNHEIKRFFSILH